jgi:hypothetical protein
VLASFGGSIVAMIAAVLVILNDISKENYRYVFIIFTREVRDVFTVHRSLSYEKIPE